MLTENDLASVVKYPAPRKGDTQEMLTAKLAERKLLPDGGTVTGPTPVPGEWVFDVSAAVNYGEDTLNNAGWLADANNNQIGFSGGDSLLALVTGHLGGGYTIFMRTEGNGVMHLVVQAYPLESGLPLVLTSTGIAAWQLADTNGNQIADLQMLSSASSLAGGSILKLESGWSCLGTAVTANNMGISPAFQYSNNKGATWKGSPQGLQFACTSPTLLGEVWLMPAAGVTLEWLAWGLESAVVTNL